jgi:hypothetical protein
MSSDYATLKNSELGKVATLVVPGNQWPTAGAYFEWHVDIPIAVPYAVATGRISSSTNLNRSLVGNYQVSMHTNGFISSVGTWTAGYTIDVFIWRASSSVVRFQAVLRNPYNEVLVTPAGDETFNLYMNTFVPPFA